MKQTVDVIVVFLLFLVVAPVDRQTPKDTLRKPNKVVQATSSAAPIISRDINKDEENAVTMSTVRGKRSSGLWNDNHHKRMSLDVSRADDEVRY